MTITSSSTSLPLQSIRSTSGSRALLTLPIRLLIVALVVVLSGSCGDSSTTIIGIDPQGLPRRLEAMDQQLRIGRVGEFLPDPIIARVTNESGVAVPGAAVRWTFTSGGGATSKADQAVSELTAVTDSRGLSQVYWKLGTVSGQQQATATLGSGGTTTTASGKKTKFDSFAKPGHIASIELLPNPVALKPGESAEFSTKITDKWGNVVNGALLSWASGSPSVATVDGGGKALGRSAGSTTITASSGPTSGTAVVNVTSTAPAGPGAVSDLEIVRVTDTSATLRWTQVGDGTGSPADYALRYGTPALDWGSAHNTEVTVSGTSIGSAMEFTFSGLQAGNAYAFGAMAYRGTPNVDAVYGSLSNVASGWTSTPGTVVSSVTITPASPATLTALGAVTQLQASVLDDTGSTMTGVTLQWSSLDPAVATVDGSGNVTAKGNGTALIVASPACCSPADTVAVTVGQVVANVTASASNLSLQIGQSAQLTAEATDRNGFAIDGATLTWSTASSSVASVDQTGKVTAVAKGSTTVTATSAFVFANVAVSVGAVASSVAITPQSPPTLTAIGATTQLQASVFDGSGSPMSGLDLQWSTLTSTVATVDGSGVVTARGNGTARIVASPVCCTAADTVVVTVNQVAASITVSPSSVDLQVGGTAKISATVKDAHGNAINGATVLWGSEASSVASVDQYGTVKGASSGATTVTALTGSLYADVAVSVAGTQTATPTSIVLSPTSLTMIQGDYASLSATVKDQNGATMSGETVTWTSANTSVATVNASGWVTAVGVGSTTITATDQGATNSLSVSVSAPSTPPTSPKGAHEPAGMTLVTDNPFNQKVAPGWTGYSTDLLSIQSDATAPASASNVGAALFPKGFVGGSGPINLKAPPLDANEFYLHFWFKVSSNWYGHDGGVNKIFFIKNGVSPATNVIPQVYGSGSNPLYFTVQIEGNGLSSPMGPSVIYKYTGSSNGSNNGVSPSASQAEIKRGQWREIEIHVIGGTPGSANGQIHVWMDGVKVMEYTGQQLIDPSKDAKYDVLLWNPTYGGGSSSVVPANQYQYLDHVYLSRR